MVLYVLYDVRVPYKTTGEKDGVHLTLQHTGHFADSLCSLVKHGIPNKGGLFIPFLHHLMDLLGVGSAEVGDKASCTGAHLSQILGRVTLLQVSADSKHRNGAQPGGSERSISTCSLSAVDHSSAPMGADGDATVYMGADIVCILYVLSSILCMKLTDSLLVQGMGLGMAI